MIRSEALKRAYGVVRKHTDEGPLHLVAGRRRGVALCGVEPNEGTWAVTMRGLVTAEWARRSPGICRDCIRALP